MLNNPDEKVSFELKDIAEKIDDKLESVAGQKMGFSLVVFNVESESRLNYVSNCNRQDVIKVYKTLLEGWEKGMPDIKAHEVS
jgi:hypothetical protein